eukprot:Pgem_evm1s9691
MDDEKIKSKILNQLKSMFGSILPTPLAIDIKIWRRERFTAHKLDLLNEGNAGHPHPCLALTESEFIGKLLFAGTETAQNNTGLLDGAVESGLRVATQLVL